MKVYCDTDTLFNNVNESDEQTALERLLAAHQIGIILMCRSRVALREVTNTKDPAQQTKLLADYDALPAIPNDERVHGFHTQGDPYGCITSPLVSDVQDEAICRELEQRGLERRDAQHITQALCNTCDVFLTRDNKTIIKPHRSWIEARFPKLKICRPSELVTELKL